MSQNYIIRSAATLHNFAKMLHIAWRCRSAHDAHHPRRILPMQSAPYSVDAIHNVLLIYNTQCNPGAFFVDIIRAVFY